MLDRVWLLVGGRGFMAERLADDLVWWEEPPPEGRGDVYLGGLEEVEEATDNSNDVVASLAIE